MCRLSLCLHWKHRENSNLFLKQLIFIILTCRIQFLDCCKRQSTLNHQQLNFAILTVKII